MNKDYTHMAIILDASGSMEGITKDTIGGFNTLIEDQKKKPGKATCTLVQFNHEVKTLRDFVPLSEIKPLDNTTYHCTGYTALYDAVCKTIDEVGQKLAAMNENDRPGLVMVVIITDGEENQSREFNLEQVKQRIKTQTDQFSWQFVFIGANIDAFSAGQQLGIKAGNTLQYTANAVGTQALFQSVSKGAANYRCAVACAGNADACRSLNYFDADDQKAQQQAAVVGMAAGNVDPIAVGTYGVPPVLPLKGRRSRKTV